MCVHFKRDFLVTYKETVEQKCLNANLLIYLSQDLVTIRKMQVQKSKKWLDIKLQWKSAWTLARMVPNLSLSFLAAPAKQETWSVMQNSTAVSQYMVPRPEASASPGNLWDKQILKPQPRIWEWGSAISVLNKPPGNGDAHLNLRTTYLQMRTYWSLTWICESTFSSEPVWCGWASVLTKSLLSTPSEFCRDASQVSPLHRYMEPFQGTVY